ncbi:hypothetical protein PT974_10660 [Cladobotryum mycophilum]|uniref:Secreted protein n=1 Tax=Cladobotryum mycophilum TaxID=491253 RepID=A0ABR0SBG9_9HYPO
MSLIISVRHAIVYALWVDSRDGSSNSSSSSMRKSMQLLENRAVDMQCQIPGTWVMIYPLHSPPPPKARETVGVQYERRARQR